MASHDGTKLGFFIGAGASIEFGIPSLKAMTKEFYERMNSNINDQTDLFNKIYYSMEEIYGKDNVDIESIISVIIGLKDKPRVKENLGDLSLFIINRNKSDIYGVYKDVDITTLNDLEYKYKDFIRDKVVLKTKGIDLLRDVYSDFFRQICNIVNCSNHRDTPTNDPYENTFSKWVFFTTNYDNAIEEYWVNHRRYLDLDLGFRQIKTKYPIMEADTFVQTNLSNVQSAMQLVKLHGSANWIRNKLGQIEEHGYNQNMNYIRSKSATGEVENDLMVYPLSQKELYFTPYIQFFRILESELGKREIWIIIGYSFRDIIIRNMFEKALRTRTRSRIILVHPRSSKIKNLFSDDVKQHIEDFSSYFAREDYVQVNQEIARRAETLMDQLQV
jgi:hemoglobin-like flavoprotein